MYITDYKIWKALDVEEIKNIKELIDVGDWIPGYSTFQEKAHPDIATNKEYNQSNFNYRFVRDIIYSSLDRSDEFIDFTLPLRSSSLLISKYDRGDYMNIHEDNPTNGDFSTTIFLNDPSAYEGGELCLYINGREEKIKLDPGYAITYSTGIHHRVNTVISGERLVVAFWTKSFCNDPFIREIYKDICKISSIIPEEPTGNFNNFEDYLKSPIHYIESIKNKIRRRYEN